MNNFSGPGSDSSDLRLYRLLIFIASLGYFAFWGILKKIDPAAYDPLSGRLLVISALVSVLLLSYASTHVKKYILYYGYLSAYLLTSYYFCLLAGNNFSVMYAIGMMTIVFGVSVVFKSSPALLAYTLYSFSGVAIAYFFSQNPQVGPLLYLSIFATVGLIAYVTMHTRIRAQEELQGKNSALEEAYRQINAQKRIVDIKNKDITDSINYAKRIQKAIVPAKESFQHCFPDSFIFYRVKDIVSGDFFWFHTHGKHKLVAAVDCTGHGVPGALMSMISITLLNHAVEQNKLVTPAEILNNLHKDILLFLQQGSNDGMDIALCSFDTETNTLSFAGAMRSLLLVRDNEITEIKGDRFPISRSHGDKKMFTNHVVKVRKEDVLYLFTDGFADQFGGPEGKKFMIKRLKQVLLVNHRLDMNKQKQALETALREWRGDMEQVDDVLVIGFRI